MTATPQRPRTGVTAARASGRSRTPTPRGRDCPSTEAQARLVPTPRAPLDDGGSQEPSATPAPTRRERRVLRVVALLALNAVLVGATAVFLGLALGPRTGEYRTLTMLTGSMRPQFPPGSVVVVTPLDVDELRPGHVITYNAPLPDRRVVTHRVVSIDRSGEKPVIVTKGDANAGDDPWKAVLNDPTVWQARFAIPYLGDGIRMLRQPEAQLAATRVLPGMLLLWLLVSIWRSDDESAAADA